MAGTGTDCSGGQPPGRDPESSARAGGLRYVHDGMPGIRRIGCGRGFRYLHPDGEAVQERETLERIRALVIPPAWTGVWICASPRGHLQATGRDARGRKQYLYHPAWGEIRNEVKFNHLLEFAEALPPLRRRVDADLRRRGLVRERVLATIVRLLELSLIRVGNEEYQRENDSYGLTTLRHHHIALGETTILFAFRGKSGKWHERSVRDRRVARVLRQMLDLPGQELFRYVDGGLHTISSDDVNSYLREATGNDLTAKDIRTWHATVAASGALRQAGGAGTLREADRTIARAVREVSSLLGNRPAACRRYYIHPLILESYRRGSLLPELTSIMENSPAGFSSQLDPLENSVKIFLQLHYRGGLPS